MVKDIDLNALKKDLEEGSGCKLLQELFDDKDKDKKMGFDRSADVLRQLDKDYRARGIINVPSVDLTLESPYSGTTVDLKFNFNPPGWLNETDLKVRWDYKSGKVVEMTCTDIKNSDAVSNAMRNRLGTNFKFWPWVGEKLKSWSNW